MNDPNMIFGKPSKIRTTKTVYIPAPDLREDMMRAAEDTLSSLKREGIIDSWEYDAERSSYVVRREV